MNHDYSRPQPNFGPPQQQQGFPNFHPAPQPQPHPHHPTHQPSQHSQLQQHVLTTIHPVVQHGLKEAGHLGFEHALTEAVAIGYLMGQGYPYPNAWKTVESWWHPPGTPLPTPY